MLLFSRMNILIVAEAIDPHRYWRVYIAGPMSGTFLGATEIEMRGTYDGPDQTGSGIALGSSQYNAGYAPSKAFDNSYIDSGGSPADIWVAGASLFPAWIGYDFGAGNEVDVVEVLYTGRETTRVAQSPGNAIIQWSDNGTNWTTSWTPGAQTTWSGTEQRIWSKPIPLVYDAYTYYRMLVTAVNGGSLVSGANITLIDENEVDRAIHTAIPGSAAASSVLSGWAPYPVSLYEAQGQDGDTTNGAAGWTTNNQNTGWNYWYLDVAQDLVGVVISEGWDARMAETFTIAWSDNGSTWNTVLTVVNETRWGVVPGGAHITYNWASEGAHRYWRINVTQNGGDSYLAIRAMRYINAAGEVLSGHNRLSMLSALSYFTQGLRGFYMMGEPGQGFVNAAGTTERILMHTGIPTKLKNFSWEPRSGETDRCPKDFTLEGSNDGLNWELLLTVVGETSWTGTTPISFDIVPFVADPPGEFLGNWSYVGADENFEVGAGIASIKFAIGGGGAGGGVSTFGTGSGVWSGSGGFVSGEFPVVEGDIITMQVANGGEGASSTEARGGRDGWPDGGPGANGDARGGAGGGSTRIWKNTTLMAAAAGGGASAGYSSGGKGGAGGGTTGQAGETTGGEGGTPTSGGRDSSDTGNALKTGGNITSRDPSRTGGFGSASGDPYASTSDDGGGGGGGWWGGGGGGGDGRPGGGGSSMTDASVTDPVNSGGARQTPHADMTGHAEYPAGASEGADKVTSGTASRGAEGWAWAQLISS